MIKNLKIFKICLYRSLIRDMTFKANFLVRFFTDAIFLIVYFVFFSVLFSKVNLIAGWSKNEILILIGTFHIINSFFLSFFFPNLVLLPESIKRGTLDGLLLKTADTQFLVSVNNIDTGSFCNVGLGLLFVVHSAAVADIKIDCSSIAMYIFYIAVGVLILYHLFFLIVISSFWLQDASWCASVYLSFNNFIDKPMEIYNGAIGRILTYILPIALVANVPARVLTGKGNQEMALAAVLILTLLYFMDRVVWKHALSRYEGASG